MIGITPQAAFSIASNIVDGENPPYTCEDFRRIMPAFSSDIIPDEQLQHFINMAQAVVKEARWLSMWPEGMRLYIAHFVTLFLNAPEAGSTKEELLNASKVSGSISSKTVGPISVGYDNTQATSDLTGWASWKLTTYGVQFVTLARMLGKGGMYVP